MLIDVKEVQEMVKDIPPLFRKNPSVVLLIKFVGKMVGAVNTLDERIKELEKTIEALKPPTIIAPR